MRASRSLTDTAHELQPTLAQYWWILFLRGALAVAFGIITLAWPQASLAVIHVFVATWLLVDGVVASLQAFTSRQRWPHVVDGSLSMAAAAVVTFYPRMSGLALTLTIACWLFAKGVTQVLIALRFGGSHAAAWLLGVLGVATAGFGAFLAHDPSDALGMMSLISGFAVLLGLSFVALGWWFER
jgi:uncharacterized membrane protein HdeD (DUF308 family)